MRASVHSPCQWQPSPRAVALLALLALLYCPATAAGEGAVTTTDERCPVPLVKVVGGEAGSDQPEGLQLLPEGLDYLSRLTSPLYLVPALGVYRGGKSLLLNRLMGRKAPYVGGFGVGHGQETFTRGISICAEEVDELGTVVWMDTEGLWSSEEATSAYGPKIFSLALLFSSSILLNSAKVLNDQFFSFFSEQQQVARVLKEGLDSQGLASESLLPGNLSVVWVLQQPIEFDSTGAASRAQLDNFLSLPGDESRARVKRDFKHLLHEVPIATYDSRLWRSLDQVADDELLPEYVNATAELRKVFLSQLKKAQPKSAASVSSQLKMYVELVQTERFSGALAKEAFEEVESGKLCEAYSTELAARVGPLPTSVLRDKSIFEEAQHELKPRRQEVAEKFHLGSEWSKRLERCMRLREEDLLRRNSEEIVLQWNAKALAVAEEGSCFFLGSLVRLLREYAATYGQAFGASVQKQAVDYASALQRTRLSDCVRLKDFLWPFAPWVMWPLCSIYLRNGLVSGFFTMGLHVVVLAGIYVMLQLFHQLPPYLDVDYRVLKEHHVVLNLVMRAPPLVPWASMARFFGLVGSFRSAWHLVKCLATMSRPAGIQHVVPGLTMIELKLNTLRKRSEAAFRQQLVTVAFEASEHLDRGRLRAGARSLLRGLALTSDVADDDDVLAPLLDSGLRKRARGLLRSFRLPPFVGADWQEDLSSAGMPTRLDEMVARGDFDGLLREMIHVLESIAQEQKEQQRRQERQPRQPPPRAASRAPPSPVSEEVEEEPGLRERKAPRRQGAPQKPPQQRRTAEGDTKAQRRAPSSPCTGRLPASPARSLGRRTRSVPSPLRLGAEPGPDEKVEGLKQTPPLPIGTGAVEKAVLPSVRHDSPTTTECECEPEPVRTSRDHAPKDAYSPVARSSVAESGSPQDVGDEDDEADEAVGETEEGAPKAPLWRRLLGGAGAHPDEEEEDADGDSVEDAAGDEEHAEVDSVEGAAGDEEEVADSELELEGTTDAEAKVGGLWAALFIAGAMAAGLALSAGLLAAGHAFELLPGQASAAQLGDEVSGIPFS